MAEEEARVGLEDSITRRAVKSSAWIAVGFGSSLILRLVSSVVLTRFIHPDTYGLMDLVMTVLVLMHLFSDIGLLPCYVQNPRGDDPKVLNTIWTLALLRNSILALVAILLAIPAADIYDRHILLWLIPVVGLVNVVEALGSPGTFVLNRHLRRGPLVVIEFVNTFITFAATLLAIYFWNPGGFLAVVTGKVGHLPQDESLTWTIVIGGLTAKVSCSALTYALIPGYRPRFQLDRKTVREVFGFGRWVLLSTAGTFLAQQTDRLVAPKLANFEASGLYGRALGLLTIATGLLEQLTNNIVFPIVSRVNEQKTNVLEATDRVSRTLGLVGGTLLSGTFVAGASLVHVIYPRTYSSVAWILQSVVVVGWLQFRSNYAGAVLLGLGKPSGPTVGSLVKLLAMVGLAAPALFVVRRMNAPPLVAIIVSAGIGELCRYLALGYLMAKMGLWRATTELRVHATMTLLTGLSAFLCVRLTPVLLGHAPSSRLDWLVSTLVGGGFVILSWGAVALVLWRQGVLRLPKKQVALAS